MAQSSVTPFRDYACELRSEVDGALEEVVQFGPGCPAPLQAAIAHSLLAPGKRLRPMLVLMAAEACGLPRGAAMGPACAVEMVHTYSLIHDDLPAMDDDDLRRGQPTCHAKFGEALAILAGDALLAAAFEQLVRGVESGDVAAQCCRELAAAAGPTALVGGQTDDLLGAAGEGSVEHLESIHRRKTGAMFLVSVRLGGLVAGATAEQLEHLNTYGKCIGLAFQIVDDLLDVGGTEGNLGKRPGKDAQLGKLTFPQLLGEQASRARGEALIEEACAAAESLGPRATQLVELARFVLERDR